MEDKYTGEVEIHRWNRVVKVEFIIISEIDYRYGQDYFEVKIKRITDREGKDVTPIFERLEKFENATFSHGNFIANSVYELLEFYCIKFGKWEKLQTT